VRKSRSWYGSWPRVPKTAAPAQLATEPILAGTAKPSKAPDFTRFDTKKRSDLASHGDTSSVKDVTSELQAPLDNSRAVDARKIPGSIESIQKKEDQTASGKVTEGADEPGPEVRDKPLPELQQQAGAMELVQRPATASGWLGWFSRTNAPDPASEPVREAETTAPVPQAQEVPTGATKPTGQNRVGASQDNIEAVREAQDPVTSNPSWFSFWSSTPTNVVEKPVEETPKATGAQEAHEDGKAVEDIVMNDAPAETVSEATSTGSTWAFWSRETRSKSPGKSAAKPEQGELAVMGEGSEAHPKPASAAKDENAPAKPLSIKDGKAKETPGKGIQGKKAKRLRPQSMDLDQPMPQSPETPQADKQVKENTSKQTNSTLKTITPTPTQSSPPNIVLPSFKSVYRMKENPSIIHQIAQLLLRTQQPQAKHVFLSQEQPKVKKAVAIGVDGLFPATYLRPMIGQPTGTSIRFANHCAEAIRRWTDSHGCEDCEIEKVALEGEGKIADRVENLWKLLLNWIEHIRSADLIMVACHSQGVPVAVMLVAKLIDLGIITTPKIGVCAMAGVSLGPFPDYKSGLLMGSALELWDFANPESEISRRHEHSLKVALDYGVRITYVGSIDDQVVPMEVRLLEKVLPTEHNMSGTDLRQSAMYSPAHHPYIYRAVFIDGRIHAPDFIAHLIGFACKLRNLGISDHGLIRELSIPLAGSLYSGEGHSRLYDDAQVYE